MTVDVMGAAQARAAATRNASDRPRERRHVEGTGVGIGNVRIQTMTMTRAADQAAVGNVGGYASVTESPYVMADMFGPYTEIVSRGSFGQTLAADPLVEFTVNHGAGGAKPLAHTRNGTLTLSEDETGLAYTASIDPARTDAADLLLALARGDMAEASFKFHIDAGTWSPDYTEFRINAVDMNKGDVSAVNFGANPAASSQLREQLAAVITKRALDPEDVNMLTQVLGWLSAIDMVVDEGQQTLAAYLQVPNPDPAEMVENALPPHTQQRLLALLAG